MSVSVSSNGHTTALNPPIGSGRQQLLWRGNGGSEKLGSDGPGLVPLLSGTQTLALPTSVTLRAISGQDGKLESFVL